MTVTEKSIVALVKSSLTGKSIPISSDTDWKCVYELGKIHLILPMLYYGIVYSKPDIPHDILKELEISLFKCITANQNQLFIVSEIFSAFNKNCIDYMPLKGTVLKHIYPKEDLRMMGDVDIMIRRTQYEKISEILSYLEFKKTGENDFETEWQKDMLLHLELPCRLVPPYNKNYADFFGDGWKLAKPSDDNKNRFVLSDEDQFIYLFTHFSRHYYDGGIGIRHFTDLWVFANNKPNLDYGYIEKTLDKLQLLDFYNNIMQTIRVWFDDAPSSSITDFITKRIFSNGAFGTRDTHAVSALTKTASEDSSVAKVKKERLIKLVFPSLKAMKKKYKILEKAPVLLPAFWVIRGLYALFKKRRVVKNSFKDLISPEKERVEKYKSELKVVGLQFNFFEND